MLVKNLHGFTITFSSNPNIQLHHTHTHARTRVHTQRIFQTKVISRNQVYALFKNVAKHLQEVCIVNVEKALVKSAAFKLQVVIYDYTRYYCL